MSLRRGSGWSKSEGHNHHRRQVVSYNLAAHNGLLTLRTRRRTCFHDVPRPTRAVERAWHAQRLHERLHAPSGARSTLASIRSAFTDGVG